MSLTLKGDEVISMGDMRIPPVGFVSGKLFTTHTAHETDKQHNDAHLYHKTHEEFCKYTNPPAHTSISTYLELACPV